MFKKVPNGSLSLLAQYFSYQVALMATMAMRCLVATHDSGKPNPEHRADNFLMIRASSKPSVDQHCSSRGWYVVATKSRGEQKAQLNLERQGYLVFLPQLSLRKRRKGKWEIITEALFPGYLFISLELGEDDPGPIRSTVGCIGLVRLGHTYTPVPAELIAALKSVAANDGVTPSAFASGDTVRLASGPFAGLEAVFDMAKGEDRALILLELLGKVQRLNVVMDSIER